jgi:hypothetical protein
MHPAMHLIWWQADGWKMPYYGWRIVSEISQSFQSIVSLAALMICLFNMHACLLQLAGTFSCIEKNQASRQARKRLHVYSCTYVNNVSWQSANMYSLHPVLIYAVPLLRVPAFR